MNILEHNMENSSYIQVLKWLIVNILEHNMENSSYIQSSNDLSSDDIYEHSTRISTSLFVDD